jgi:hypothetical protein
MTKQVELWGGSLDGAKVTVAAWASTYQYFKQGILDSLRRQPVVRIETYEDRGGNKFTHTKTEKRDA